MPLEEDIVTQRLSQGSDRKDMASFVEALEEVGLKIDRKKVDVAVERYELIQKYNSVSRKDRKRIIETKFKEICKSHIDQALMKSASIISANIKCRYTDRCRNCARTLLGYEIRYKKINELEGIYSIVKGTMDDFKYCHHCGNSSV